MAIDGIYRVGGVPPARDKRRKEAPRSVRFEDSLVDEEAALAPSAVGPSLAPSQIDGLLALQEAGDGAAESDGRPAREAEDAVSLLRELQRVLLSSEPVAPGTGKRLEDAAAALEALPPPRDPRLAEAISAIRLRLGVEREKLRRVNA
jgi:hypothetical protein